MKQKKASLGFSLALGMLALLGLIIFRTQMRGTETHPADTHPTAPAVEAPEPPPPAPAAAVPGNEPARQTIPEVVPPAPAERSAAPGAFPFAKLNPTTVPADKAGVTIEHRAPDPNQPLPTGEAALPEDLRRQLEAEPPELPDDMKAQVTSQPEAKELPDDIQRAIKSPPRFVTLDEVNNPANATVTETK